MYCSKYVFTHFVAVLSFSAPRIAINETDIKLILQLNRTGSLDFSFNISCVVTKKSFGYLLVYLLSPDNLITFPANTSDINVTIYVWDNKKYNGPQTMQYCLIPQNGSGEDKTTLNFVHQCMDITVYDEEDCK